MLLCFGKKFHAIKWLIEKGSCLAVLQLSVFLEGQAQRPAACNAADLKEVLLPSLTPAWNLLGVLFHAPLLASPHLSSPSVWYPGPRSHISSLFIPPSPVVSPSLPTLNPIYMLMVVGAHVPRLPSHHLHSDVCKASGVTCPKLPVYPSPPRSTLLLCSPPIFPASKPKLWKSSLTSLASNPPGKPLVLSATQPWSRPPSFPLQLLAVVPGRSPGFSPCLFTDCFQHSSQK